MAKYMVTGALVQVPAVQADGSKALTYRYQGAIIDIDGDLAEHLLDVNLIAKVADVDNDPVANPAQGPTPPPAPLVPSKDDDKSVWEAHAVRSGLSESDAKVASKEDLIAIFADGGLEPAKAEPAKVEPVKAPAKAAPAKSTPAKAAPAKAAPPSKS